MSLTIYGPAQSRAFRVLWMAHELGLDFESDPGIDLGGNGASEALLAVNPMGQVPAIDDDGFILTESMAINLYLAGKYGKLAPESLQDRAGVLRWSFWVMTAVETTLLEVLLKKLGILGQEQDPEAVKAGIEKLQRPLNVLNDALAGRDYLIGNEFTVADLNVAGVLSWAKLAGIDLSAQPHVAAWLDRCLGRKAAQQARG